MRMFAAITMTMTITAYIIKSTSLDVGKIKLRATFCC